jgi:hypothetical protein
MQFKIPANFWTDERLDDEKPDVRFAVVWIHTNPRMTMPGFSTLNKRFFVAETGLPEEALTKGFKALGKGLVEVDGGYWVREHIATHFKRGPLLVRNLICKAVCRSLLDPVRPQLIDLVMAEYPELRIPYDIELLGKGECKGYISPTQGLHKPLVRGNTNTNTNTDINTRVGGPGEGIPDGPAPASGEDVAACFASLEAPQTEADAFFDHYNANGWRQSSGLAIVSWQSQASKWVTQWKRDSKKSANGSKNGEHFDPSTPDAHTGGFPVAN